MHSNLPPPPPHHATRCILLLLLIWNLLLVACAPLTPAVLPADATASSVLPPSTTPAEASLPPAVPTATPVPFVESAAPSSPPQPVASCQQQPGRLQLGALEDPRLPKPMRYIVYLPPCYDQSGLHYPVLYLLHGLGYAEDQWPRLGIAETADRLVANGEIRPFIIVMPYNYGAEPPASDPFDDVLLDTLIPRVDAAYRTLPSRENRAIGGLSRGGGWAIHLGVRQYTAFAIVGAHSPAIFYADNATLKMRLLQISPEMMPRFYIDIGDADQDLKPARAFEALLEDLNIEHTWRLNIGAHTEDYWRAHVEDYLRWYSAQFPGE
ncbi:MAG: alpha/beta hydrolase-fold protein [Anaerolineales bacterium]